MLDHSHQIRQQSELGPTQLCLIPLELDQIIAYDYLCSSYLSIIVQEMASDDEILPILENEVSGDVRDDRTETNSDNSAPTHPIGAGDDDSDVEIHLTGCGASAFCDPRRMPHRFIALFLMCLLGFGSTFCYDNPGISIDSGKYIKFCIYIL